MGTCRHCSEELSVSGDGDRADVLKHYVENHPTSETLSEALELLETQTECSGCGTEFAAVPSVGRDAGVSPRLYLPAFCDDCGEDDRLNSLLVAETTPEEVLLNE